MTTRVIKNGGAKGEAITAAIRSGKYDSRKAVAEAVGCTVGRVGESLRFMLEQGDADAAAFVERVQAAKDEARAARPAKGKTYEASAETYKEAAESIKAGKRVPAAKLEAANAYAKQTKKKRLAQA